MKKVDLEEKQLLEGVPHWLKGLLLLLVGLFLFAAYRYFTDGYYWNGEKWTIREDYRERVIEKMESFDDCVVYYLIARTAGYYPCRHCDRETFYLLAGETWKIGNSCNEQERYDEDWLKKMNMDMKIVYEGDLTGAAKEAALRRLSILLSSPLAQIILARNTTVDLKKAINTPGKVIIFDLSYFGKKTADLIGKFVLSYISGLIYTRDANNKNTPCYIYIDEAHRVMTDTIETMTTEARKYGGHLYLATQHFDQLEDQKSAAKHSIAVKICRAKNSNQLHDLITVPNKYLKKNTVLDSKEVGNRELNLRPHEWLVETTLRPTESFIAPYFIPGSKKWNMTEEQRKEMDLYQKEKYYSSVEGFKPPENIEVPFDLDIPDAGAIQ